MGLITKYFPQLSQQQMHQYEMMGTLYPEWNEKINVISRKDIDNLYPNHILHSLAIAKFLGELRDGTTLVDLGTGGGFPGIPLAVFYPSCRFHLIDRIGKKIKVAQAIAEAIGLDNVTFQHGDMGECHTKFDYVVSRAVMTLPELVKISSGNVDRKNNVNKYHNGLVCLKGGNLAEEIAETRMPVMDFPLTEYFNEPFFDTKSLIYVPYK
ncbi:16S rRNA (guanine(527)-N(7))-methyltransferase RsmG [Muribaculaceae bacterium Isolate-002 (NCI)]|nr:16S rRNA (guanine(527)-N(7))-methyltransferase RsmG [Muribaculaceae bacterium Isolate-002 (NCI)]